MRGVMRLLTAASSRKPARPASNRTIRSFQPSLEALDDRCVPATLSTITSNFNGTTIPAGDTIWFSSVFKESGAGSAPVTIHVTNQTISFSASGTDYTIAAPDSTITISPTATTATTWFDAATDSWETVVPSSFSGNAFLSGAAFQLTTPLPGGINPVKWTASFTTDTPGVSLNWQWAASVYTQFISDYNALDVKPLDAKAGTLYSNSDHAGTPESYKMFVTGGARGGGGSNFTGSLSATAKVTPAVETATGSLSGYVYNDADFNGQFDSGETGLGGVVIVLTGTNDLGETIELSTTTDDNGYYEFTGLRPGNYTLSEGVAVGYSHNASNAGTVNGNPEGVAGYAEIDSIELGAGASGIDFDFGEVLPNS